MSKRVKTIDVLRETRKLVANKNTWLQGEPAVSAKGRSVMATSKKAARWCVLGALVKVTKEKVGDKTSDMVFPKGMCDLLASLDR